MIERGGVPGESWVQLIFPGAYKVQTADGERETVMTVARLQAIADNTNRLIRSFKARARAGKTAFSLPIRVEHEAGGARLGDIDELRFADLDSTGHALWAYGLWSEGAWRAIEQKDIKFVSIGTEPNYIDELGNSFGEVLVEFSVVDHPLIKDIGTLQDTMSLRASALKVVERFNNTPTTPTQDTTMTDDQIKAMADAIGARVEQAMAPLGTKMDAMMKVLADAATAPTPPAKTPEEPKQPEDVKKSEEAKKPEQASSDPLEEAMKKLDGQQPKQPEQASTKAQAEAMSARLDQLTNVVLKLTERATGLQFSERGNSTPTHVPTSQPAASSFDRALEAAKAQGLTGDAAVTAALKA